MRLIKAIQSGRVQTEIYEKSKGRHTHRVDTYSHLAPTRIQVFGDGEDWAHKEAARQIEEMKRRLDFLEFQELRQAQGE